MHSAVTLRTGESRRALMITATFVQEIVAVWVADPFALNDLTVVAFRLKRLKHTMSEDEGNRLSNVSDLSMLNI